MYSLGMVLYQLLVGMLPLDFPAEPGSATSPTTTKLDLERIALSSRRRADRHLRLRCTRASRPFADERCGVAGDEGGRVRTRKARLAPGGLKSLGPRDL